jgi:hypothetical protein
MLHPRRRQDDLLYRESYGVCEARQSPKAISEPARKRRNPEWHARPFVDHIGVAARRGCQISGEGKRRFDRLAKG